MATNVAAKTDNTAKIAGAVIFVAAVGTAAAVAISKKKQAATTGTVGTTPAYTPVATTLTLKASSATVDVNQSDLFQGTLLDQNNNPMPNQTVMLYDAINIPLPLLGQGVEIATTTTDANGNYEFNVTFTQAATYSLYAQV